MTSKLNKLLLLLLAAALIFSLAASTALAVEYRVWVGSTRVTSDNLSGDGWSYDPDTKTLTLDNPTINSSYENCSIFSGVENLTISGNASIGGNPYGIYAMYGLNLTGGTINVSSTNNGTSIYVSGNLTISGSGTTVTATKTGEEGDSIYLYNGDFTITDATLNGGVRGSEIGKATITNANLTGGVSGSTELKISSSTVNGYVSGQTATIETSTITGTGIGGGQLTIESGTINVEEIQGNYIIINGGMVTANNPSEYGWGIRGHYSVTVNGGTVSATGGGYGICGYNGGGALTINDGTVTAKATTHEAVDFGSVTVNGGTLEGIAGTSSAISASSGITMASTHGVVLPEGGQLSSDGKNVCESDGTTIATHAKIAPKETPAATHTVTVNNGKAYDGPGAAGQVITKAAEGDKVYVRFPDITIPEGKYVAGYTSEQVGQQRYDELTDGIVLNFTMPAKDVVLDAILEDQTDLVVDLTDGTEAYASGPFSLLYNSLYSAAGQGLIDLDDSGAQRLVDLDKDSNNDIIINGADDAIDLHSECNIKGELTVLNINYGAYKSITFKFKMFDGDLPVVNGATINFTDVTKDGDSYKLNTDGAEEAIFADSAKTADITFVVNPFFEDQAMTTKLTAAPESGVPVYFIVGLEAYEDKDPLEPTVEWAANATIMAQSQLTAENGEIEIVEISHSPAGGTLSLICKYTSDESVTYAVTVSGGTADVTEAAEGDTVTVKADNKSGYTFKEWQVEPADVSLADKTAAETTFEMPAADVKLTAIYTKDGSGDGSGGSSTPAKEEVNVVDTDNGEVSVDPEEAKKGQEVTVTPEPDEGYEVDEVKVTDEDGKAIPVTDNGDGTYSFKMPDGPVDVEVTFKDKDGFSDVGPEDWFYEEVLYAVDNGLMNGVGHDLFAPYAPTSRAMIVTILYRMEGEPEAAAAAPFSDVPAGQWYSDAVAWASENGIVLGFPDGTFRPDDIITREQFAAILYRYAQHKGYDVSARADLSAFADAERVSDWALPAVQWEVGVALFKGDDQGNLRPQDWASRAEAATLFRRFAVNVI